MKSSQINTCFLSTTPKEDILWKQNSPKMYQCIKKKNYHNENEFSFTHPHVVHKIRYFKNNSAKVVFGPLDFHYILKNRFYFVFHGVKK